MYGRHCGPGWMGEIEQVRRQRRGPGGWGGGWPGGWGGGWGDARGFTGPPPWVRHLFAGHAPAGRGPRVRRGDVRSAILHVLHEEERLNGYQLIQQITDRTRGAWKPSPGSVYPTIAQLEDEGLIETVAGDGRRSLQLTDAGRHHVAEHADELAAVWEPFDEDGADGEDSSGFPAVLGQLMGAVWQVFSTGSPDQQERAVEILADTRRRLYGLLADGPEDVRDGTEEE